MLGLALLGAGRMAKAGAESISAAGAKLVTVFDVAEAAVASLARGSTHPWLGQRKKASNHPEVAAVLMATSSDTPAKYVIEAVQAGKAVMCEKPLGTRAGPSC